MLDKFKLLGQFMQFLIVAVASVGLYGILEVGRNISSGEIGTNTLIHALFPVITFFIAKSMINSGSPKEADSAPAQSSDDFYNEK